MLEAQAIQVDPPDMPGTSAPQLSWIVPLYRTRDFVGELCTRIDAVSRNAGLAYEIIFVDDACPQNSKAAAQIRVVQFPIRVISLAENHGQDGALREGMRVCGAPWVLIIDGDLQDPPEVMQLMWAKAQEGYDVVFADRHGAYEPSGRLITSKLYRLSLRVLGCLPPGAGLFALISREVYSAVAMSRSRKISIVAVIAAVKGRYTSIPVRRSAREHGRSSYSTWMRVTKAVVSLWQVTAARFLHLDI